MIRRCPIRHRRVAIVTLGWIIAAVVVVGCLFACLRASNGTTFMWSNVTRLELDLAHESPLGRSSTDEYEPPHLPLDYLSTTRNPRRSFNESCAILPTLFDLKINNVHWQHLVTNDGSNFYLYGAYHDWRPFAVHNRVRILAMVDRIPPPTTFCQVWRERVDEPSFSRAPTTHHHIWNVHWNVHGKSDRDDDGGGGTLQPILLTCPTSDFEERASTNAIAVVSLVERLCDNATNALRVLAGRPKSSGHQSGRPKIAVCVKGLNYLDEDRSLRLIEWLELIGLLGADRVFTYDLGVHWNVTRVLRHYERRGFVDVRPLTLAGDQMNEPRRLRALYLARRITRKRQNELIPYNDCLYRNVGLYDYVLPLDTDEVIVPVRLGLNTWQQMLRLAASRSPSSAIVASAICARNVYFFDDFDVIPFDGDTQRLHMLSHVRRVGNYSKIGEHVKCFHDTATVMTLHNHYPMACHDRHGGRGRCRRRHLDTGDGRLQHYRNGCTLGLRTSNCANRTSDTVVDTLIWRYGKRLMARVRATLRQLQFE